MKIKYLCYFRNSEGVRDGVEVIEASSREEAREIYKRFFNVKGECNVIPRIEVERKG
tara:strand:- start:385 stop:555 length:171 start_codon:yes stop_codon:yes gene_type:complete